MQAITLTASAFSLTIATPEGQPIKFSDADDVSENTRRWMSEFKARPLSKPVPLEDVDRKPRTWCTCMWCTCMWCTCMWCTCIWCTCRVVYMHVVYMLCGVHACGVHACGVHACGVHVVCTQYREILLICHCSLGRI